MRRDRPERVGFWTSSRRDRFSPQACLRLLRAGQLSIQTTIFPSTRCHAQPKLWVACLAGWTGDPGKGWVLEKMRSPQGDRGFAPPLIIYAFLMEYYISGLTAGATKGYLMAQVALREIVKTFDRTPALQGRRRPRVHRAGRTVRVAEHHAADDAKPSHG
jgi:hypothetical protein